MSDDQAEREAQELLPDNLFGYNDHKREARQAVAAALRERDERVRRDLEGCNIRIGEYQATIKRRDFELAALRAKVVEWQELYKQQCHKRDESLELYAADIKGLNIEIGRLRAKVEEQAMYIDQLTVERNKAWIEINEFKPTPSTDFDDEEGCEPYCMRCGLGWDSEKDNDDRHVCPPGFWNDYEKKLAAAQQENQVRFVAGLETARKIADDVRSDWKLMSQLANPRAIIDAIDARIAAEKKEGG